MTANLHQFAYDCLAETEVDRKRAMAKALFDGISSGELVAGAIELPTLEEAGRPARPVLVHPREVPKRKLGSISGRAAAIQLVNDAAVLVRTGHRKHIDLAIPIRAE